MIFGVFCITPSIAGMRTGLEAVYGVWGIVNVDDTVGNKNDTSSSVERN